MGKSLILEELREHWPFALGASIDAAILSGILYNHATFASSIESLFEIFHPAHVLFSAAATTAIYYKYRKSVIPGILIGVIGAILIGTLSDVLLPWVAGNLFSLHTHFHLPIFEEPLLIIGVGIVGAFVGIYWKIFNLSHSIHVFLSVFASLFYLLAFSAAMGFWTILAISLVVFFTVFIPCCISDIAFPLWFVKRSKK